MNELYLERLLGIGRLLGISKSIKCWVLFNISKHKSGDFKDVLFDGSATSKEDAPVYLATRDSMKTISFSYRLGLSTVYQIIIKVCYAIIEIIMPEVMLVPTEQKWKEIASEFWTC
ncbi:protein ANTAGONIST OF LIKE HETEROCHROMATIN PROTEIN 1-like [Aphis craccivora]|uniref:Protein ANTAGONIST OF LIKE HETEROCHROMATIN PROTEIN 1-like n=1 Tax=Aphis craccivora TaxID=307492 RepID=A0A6G0WMH6_APHCR|nr:protein ANTAGONIST OF LIKE HETEROCHROMATIN PROTEIN 1-like [Aphis craccivora]